MLKSSHTGSTHTARFLSKQEQILNLRFHSTVCHKH